jgi:hypothetical protein
MKLYSERKNGKKNVSLAVIKSLYIDLFDEFQSRYYFQEAFGYYCDNNNYRSVGKIGEPERYFFRIFKKNGLFPTKENFINLTEDELFDVVELAFHLISRPIKNQETTTCCNWNGGCTAIYNRFSKKQGQKEYVLKVNDILNEYYFQMTSEGQVLKLPEEGLINLINKQTVPINQSTDERISHAVDMFFNRKASFEDKRSACKALADVLEHIRPDISQTELKEDVKDLFHIINTFTIRHNKKTTKEIQNEEFLDWIFYSLLNSIKTYQKLKIKIMSEEDFEFGDNLINK